MEDALSQVCAVFISGGERIEGWQNEQMRTAIQGRVEDDARYRVIPVLLPGVTPPNRRDLPRFLRWLCAGGIYTPRRRTGFPTPVDRHPGYSA